jgi:hypothetical protein
MTGVSGRSQHSTTLKLGNTARMWGPVP